MKLRMDKITAKELELEYHKWHEDGPYVTQGDGPYVVPGISIAIRILLKILDVVLTLKRRR